MKKYFSALLFAAVLCLCIAPSSFAAQSDFIIENGILREYVGLGGDVVIPEGVTEIGRRAFERCTDLTSITLPSSLKSIGYGAFEGCKKLDNVVIPKGVTIESYAFSGCTSLENFTVSADTIIHYEALNVTPYLESLSPQGGFLIVAGSILKYQGPGGAVVIPAGVTNIQSGILNTVNRETEFITSVVIPEGVTEIGDGAFEFYTGLTSITLPSSLKSIGDRAFRGCKNLDNVVIPKGVTIGVGAFMDCTSLKNFIASDAIIINTDSNGHYWAALGGTPYLESLLPQGDFLIAGSTLLEYRGPGGDVVIPDGVKRIGEFVFSDDSPLTSITIPNSVVSIGDGAFWDCNNLTHLEIPSSVVSIGENAFFNCEGLTHLEIPEGVTEIGGKAFSGCTDLSSVTLPSSLKTIGAFAFSSCRNLDNVIIPDGVETIDGWAFSGCTSLKNLSVPESVSTIGAYAFEWTPWLKDKDGFIVIGDILLGYRGPGGTITVPEHVRHINQYAFIESTDKAEIRLVIPDGVESIGQSAFSDCADLASVEIPDSVGFLGESAFNRCKNLTDVTIPDDLVINFVAKYHYRWGSDGKGWGYCFAGTPFMQQNAANDFIVVNGILVEYLGQGGEIVVPDGTTYPYFGINVINSLYPTVINIGKVTKIVFPGSLKVFPKGSLRTGAETLEFKEGVTTIESYAIICSAVKKVVIPSSVTEIGEMAFYDDYDSTLHRDIVSLPDGLTIYGEAGSYAETYAKQYGIPFIAIDLPDSPTAYASTQTVKIDDKDVTFECYALKNEKGYPTNYIKLRDLAYVLNGTAAQFEVGWNGKTSTISLTTGQAYTANGSEMSTPFSGDRSYATSASQTTINGQVIELEAITLTNDRGGAYNYFKLRDLGEALGFTVDWTAEKGIFIETK